MLLTIQELTDDFLKLFVESRVRILDGLEEFVKHDIGFGWKWNGQRFSGFSSILLMYSSCKAETAPDGDFVYVTDKYQ